MSLYGAVRCHRLLSRMNFTLSMNSVIEPCTSGCTPDRIQLANHSSMYVHYIHCVRLPFEVRSSRDRYAYLLVCISSLSILRTHVGHLHKCIYDNHFNFPVYKNVCRIISFRLSSGLSLSDWTPYYLVNAKVTVSI